MKQAQSVIPHIIDQHAEEAAFLWLLRHNAVYTPHYNLKDLTKLDERVEAHIDGIRIAGESFSFIRGVDIAYDDLEGELPKNFVVGPTETLENEKEAMDPDNNLPGPDPLLIERCWKQHQHNFLPGVRYLLGNPVNELQCQNVLRSGKQRQRHAAALELSLMHPTTPLIETRAMGKRLQKLLS